MSVQDKVQAEVERLETVAAHEVAKALAKASVPPELAKLVADSAAGTLPPFFSPHAAAIAALDVAACAAAMDKAS